MNDIRAAEIPDRPISSAAEDSLGRTEFAASIAESILNSPSGGTLRVGVYGGWGEGKSSVLVLVQKRLEARGEVCVWLTPWTAGNREEFVDQLLRTIADALGIDLKSFKRVSWFAKSAESARRASGSDVRFAMLDGLLGPTLQRISASKLKEQVDRLRTAIRRSLGPRRLIVFVDDLDRVRPDLVPGVLLTLREVLDEPDFYYVLAFAPEVVETGLRAVHEGWGGPREFLEKIIELPRYLPEPDEFEVRAFINAQISQVGEAVDAKVLQDLLPLLPRNPRRLKLLIRHLASLSSLLRRFDDTEIDRRTLYIGQVLRIEFPAETVALTRDQDTLTHIAGGRSRELLEEALAKGRGETKPEPQYPERAYAPGDATRSSRFLFLCSALRERGIGKGYYDLQTLLSFPDWIPAVTYGEVFHFCDAFQRRESGARGDWLREWLRNEHGGLDYHRTGATWRIVIRLRDAELELAADADLEPELVRHLNRASDFLQVLQALSDDLRGFESGLLTETDWTALFQHFAKWAHFIRPDYYREARNAERTYLEHLSHTVPPGLLAAMVESLRPVWGHRQNRESEFQSLVDRLYSMAEMAAASEILSLFCEPDGMERFWAGGGGPARTVLTRLDSVLYGKDLLVNLRGIANRSQREPRIQENFVTFFRLVHYWTTVGGWESHDRVVESLRSTQVLTIIWRAVVANPLNPRMAGTLREQRAELIRMGIPDDHLPLPRWWERLEDTFFRSA